MPDYRNDFQQRRPPQRFERRRNSYEQYRSEPRRERSDSYIGQDNSRRPGGPRMQERDYPYRRPAVRSSAPGEYLADSSQDRYSEQDAYEQDTYLSDGFENSRNESVPAASRFNRRASARRQEESVDFSDIDSYDPDDEWFAQRMTSSVRSRPEAQEEPDGFEDMEDTGRRRDTAAHLPKENRNESWNENRSMDASDGFDFSAGDVQPPAPRRGGIIIAVCVMLAVLAAVGALIAVSLGKSRTLLPIESAARSISLERAQDMVAAHVDRRLSQTTCSITVDGRSSTFSLADCEFSFAGYEEDPQSEYVVGTDPETGVVTRTEYAVDGMFRYNKTALRSLLDSMVDNSVPVIDPGFEIDYETGIMTVHSGQQGWGVDHRQFLSQLNSSLLAAAGDAVNIVCTSGNISTEVLSAEEIYKKAATEPVNAYTTTDSAGQTVYHSEINGIDFDKSELAKLIAAGGSSWEIKVKVTYPEINLKEIKKYTFPDVLSTYYTYYVTNAYERSHNLALAAEHINTTILEPGEQFSFNDVVGQRTPENGFKKATVYLGEGTAEDYGGGICQTSSTLYYTCILANLQIDERQNHMYTVNYMQTAKGRRTVYGNDATVNWGYTDYKFSNNKEYPIRIDMWAKGGILTCEIRGTADGSTADFAYDTLSTTPFKIKYLKDNGSPTQEGHTGYRVNVYRIIYQDGVEVERVLESKNSYQPMTKIYYTNELPEGYEYGVEYEQDYVPTTTDPNATTTAAPTEPTVPPTESTETVTTTTAAPTP